MANRKATKLSKVTRAKVLRIRRERLRLTEFAPKEKSIAGRIAELLDWAAQRYPRNVLTYEEITQSILGLGKLPTKSQQVMSTRSAVARARQTCRKRYSRDVITIPGVGARATVDSADTLQHSVLREVASHQRSCIRLKETAALVDSKELDLLIAEAPVNIRGDLQLAKDWFSEYLGKYIKQLEKPAMVQALLPPALSEE